MCDSCRKTRLHRIVILILCRMYPSTCLTKHWYESLPIITKWWFGMALVLTLSGNLGFVSPMKLIFSLDEITSNFEVWRILSCFCYVGGFSLPTLVCLIMLVQFSNRYETSIPYNTGGGGGTADYAFALVFCMITMLITGPLVSAYFVYLPTLYTDNMVYFVVYVWSKRNPTSQASIWGFPFGAKFFPFYLLAFNLVIGDYIVPKLHGLVVGHLYYYLVDIVPLVYGKDVLKTPRILIDWLGVGDYSAWRVHAPTSRNDERPNNGTSSLGGGRGQTLAGGRSGHNWGGSGHVLGRK